MSAAGDDLGRYRHYLLMLARLHMGGHFRGKLDESDLVQQTLLDAHRNFDQCRGDNEPQRMAWMRKILANNIGMALRSMFRDSRDVAREQNLHAMMDASSASLQSLFVADDSSPSRRVRTEEDILRLSDALSQLPEDNRQALMMRYCQNMPLKDIADALGRTPRAVGGLLQRGLDRLRELLAPEDTSHG